MVGDRLDADNGGISYHPDYEKLKVSVSMLRAELEAALIERDTLLIVTCKNIETKYMVALGGLEYRVYELNCEIMRQKRKSELIQARKNRQEEVSLDAVEEHLDREFAEYSEKLKEQVRKLETALAHDKAASMPDKEAKELKTLYHTIVKALHPDLNPTLGADMVALFNKAVAAYEKADLVTIRVIASMIMGRKYDMPGPDCIAELKGEKERLKELVLELARNIEEIKSDFPYNKKAMLEDPEAVKACQRELEAVINSLVRDLDIWKAAVAEMLR